MRYVRALLILVVALAIPAQAQKSPKPFVDRQLGITYMPPAGWRSQEIGDRAPGAQAMYVGPSTDGASPLIGWGALAGEFVELTEEVIEQVLTPHYRTRFPNFEVTGTARIRVGGRDAVSIAGSATSGRTTIRNRQIFVAHQGHLFTFLFIAGESAFPRFVGVFEKMVNSVRFTPRTVASAAPAEVPRDFVHRTLGITYPQPAGWSPVTPGRDSDMLVAYSGPARNRVISRIEWGQALTPNRQLDSLSEETIRRLQESRRKRHPDYAMTATARLQVGGRDAMRLDGSYTSGEASLRERQIVVFLPGRMFLFVCIAEAAAFPEVVGDFEKMLQSVRFTAPGSTSVP